MRRNRVPSAQTTPSAFPSSSAGPSGIASRCAASCASKSSCSSGSGYSSLSTRCAAIAAAASREAPDATSSNVTYGSWVRSMEFTASYVATCRMAPARAIGHGGPPVARIACSQTPFQSVTTSALAAEAPPTSASAPTIATPSFMTPRSAASAVPTVPTVTSRSPRVAS